MKARIAGGFAFVFVAGLIAWLLAHRATLSNALVVNGAPGGSSSTETPARHPSPPRLADSPPADSYAEDRLATNLIQRLTRLANSNQLPVLKPEQLEAYLRENRRSAGSLLGAFYTTQDRSLLAEAAEKFPSDPRVAFAAATLGTPEDRRKWIDTFKQDAPDNAAGDYLSAADYFRSGQTNLALADVQAAMDKPLRDYHLDSLQNAEEAYVAAGYSELEAKTLASFQLLLPELAQYKQAGVGLTQLAQSQQQAGDTASAQASLQLAMNLAQRLDNADSLTLIQQLVGVAIQKTALETMDPNALYGDQTVQSQLNALVQQREAFKSLDQQAWTAVQRMSDGDLLTYFERLWSFGSISARRWAIDRFSTPSLGGP